MEDLKQQIKDVYIKYKKKEKAELDKCHDVHQGSWEEMLLLERAEIYADVQKDLFDLGVQEILNEMQNGKN